METDLLSMLQSRLYCCSIPGAAGGITWFLWAVRQGSYRNNRYLMKFSTEILGASLTATFLASLISSGNYLQEAAFAVGVGWTGVIQILRSNITKHVEKALGQLRK